MSERIFMGISGVYAITNLRTGFQYIGSSHDIGVRWRSHLTRLHRYRHHSSMLQYDWCQYGKEYFVLGVLEEVHDRMKIFDREQYYIDLLSPQYNLRLKVGHPRNNPAKYYKPSEFLPVLRRLAGLTQFELARLCRLPESAVSKCERGYPINIATVQAIVDGLNACLKRDKPLSIEHLDCNILPARQARFEH